MRIERVVYGTRDYREALKKPIYIYIFFMRNIYSYYTYITLNILFNYNIVLV